MATVACPECGLPRAESELGARPCPVCAAAPVASAPARRAKPSGPDPTAGMPADASELNAPGARATRAPGSLALPLGAMLFVGVLVGVLGVLGVQALNELTPKPNGDVSETAEKSGDEPAPAPVVPPKPQPRPAVLEVAPPPHDPDPELAPDPRPLLPPPPRGRVTTIETGPNPPDVFVVPFPMKTGEHVILKGKVKMLKVSVLDEGAILDASGLETASVYISGKIDNRSTLKLNVPNGVVHIGGKVDNKSVVEIDAPGGEVKFLYVTVGAKEGSKIDSGSKVAITARVVEFKGDVSGTDTKVSLLLTRNAWLKVASVSGKATVEYKSQAAGWAPPDVIIGVVAPTATFRKAGE